MALFIFMFFRLLIKTIDKAQHNVARDDVCVVFPAASAVDAGIDVGQVAQNVPGIKHQIKPVLQEILRKSRVPN